MIQPQIARPKPVAQIQYERIVFAHWRFAGELSMRAKLKTPFDHRAALQAVLKVGDGRGFVVEGSRFFSSYLTEAVAWWSSARDFGFGC